MHSYFKGGIINVESNKKKRAIGFSFTYCFQLHFYWIVTLQLTACFILSWVCLVLRQLHPLSIPGTRPCAQDKWNS